MSATGGFSREVLWVGAMLALTAGCAGLDVPDPLVADITDKRQARSEQAVGEFESKRDLAELQSALAHWNQGDVAASEEVLRRLLKRNPNHREAQLLMAEVCPADGGQTPPEAVEPVEAVSADSTGLPGHSVEASAGPAVVIPDPTARPLRPVSTLAGNRAHGSKAAAPADETRRASATLRFAVPRETAGYPLGGVDSAGSAEATETDGVRALIDKGRAALAEGSADEAMVYFQQAAALRPNDPQILIAAAMAALRADRPEVAVELLRPAGGTGVTPVARQAAAQLYRILGVAYYRLEDYQSSEVALRQALSLDKSSALSYLLMGCTLSKLGQFESAEAHLRQARTINPRYTVRR